MKALGKRHAAFICAFALALLIVVPTAWAIGWTTVGSAEVHFNDLSGKGVSTVNPQYQSQMRLYVQGHSPCGPVGHSSNNFYMEYIYPSGAFYAISSFREICTAAETPSVWGVDGGNKYAICGELYDEQTNPVSTCQRYSTT
jgi:hypothetical protein